MRWSIFAVIILIVAVLGLALHDPVCLVIYKIREPYFSYPIHSSSKKLIIRNDSFGDGDFGAKRRNGRSHAGIDIEAVIGTPVYAARSGIAFKGNVPMGYGKYIMIYHPDGYQSFYGHLSDWAVVSGEKVAKGRLIGYSGKTGNAANKKMIPHLHFEIRKNDEPQDPQPVMR